MVDRLETISTVLWQSAGGNVSLILPNVRFGSVFQYHVTYTEYSNSNLIKRRFHSQVDRNINPKTSGILYLQITSSMLVKLLVSGGRRIIIFPLVSFSRGTTILKSTNTNVHFNNTTHYTHNTDNTATIHAVCVLAN